MRSRVVPELYEAVQTTQKSGRRQWVALRMSPSRSQPIDPVQRDHSIHSTITTCDIPLRNSEMVGPEVNKQTDGTADMDRKAREMAGTRRGRAWALAHMRPYGFSRKRNFIALGMILFLLSIAAVVVQLLAV